MPLCLNKHTSVRELNLIYEKRKKMNKKFLTLARSFAAVSALVLSVGTGLAYASVNSDFTNDTTGSNSENTSEQNSDMEYDINVDSHSSLENDTEVSVETGNGEIENNTMVEDYQTGDIEADINFDNELNGSDSIDWDFGDLFGSVHFNASNELTGYNSENENEINVDREVNIDIENCASISNDIDFDANTGDNEVENNTVVGDIETGDINISSDISNVANGNASMIDLGDIAGNDISADFTNDTTGSNSENENTINAETEVDVNIDNHANIHNEYEIDTNTGDNEIENNTSVGDIKTGSVRINITGVNQAN